MGVSFGIAKKVIESGPYNLGIALPFTCAFYIANQTSNIHAFGFDLGEIASFVFRCGLVSLSYFSWIMIFALAAAASSAVQYSKAGKITVAIIAVLTLASALFGEQISLAIVFLATIAVAYLALSRWDEGSLSLGIVSFIGISVAISSAALGVLWFDDRVILSGVVAFIFGMDTVNPATNHIGSAMLITLGYVSYYSVVTINEILSPH